MFPLNMNTEKEVLFCEKLAINNFYQMFLGEPSFMSDTRNQCLQLVPYLKRGLVHKLVCKVPFDQDKIFLSGTRTNSRDLFYYYTR